MGREWLLLMLVVSLGGLALQAFSWFPSAESHDERGAEFEHGEWLRLWYPIVPALIVVAWLGGWTVTEPDPVRDRLGIWTLYAVWAPFAVIVGRAAVRAVLALLRRPPDSGVSTIGFIRPQTVFSPFLAKQLDDTVIRAALAHERAHARHRDPLRIWLAQFVSDLQWPWPSAQRRLKAWLVALELVRDEEARESGVDGADLAAAVLATIRFLRQVPMGEPATFNGTLFAHAYLIGDSLVLRERVSRLLAPLPERAHGGTPGRLTFQVAVLVLVPVLVIAAMLGVVYGEQVMRVVLALTS